VSASGTAAAVAGHQRCEEEDREGGANELDGQHVDLPLISSEPNGPLFPRDVVQYFVAGAVRKVQRASQEKVTAGGAEGFGAENMLTA
jgi:hypothetical protein